MKNNILYLHETSMFSGAEESLLNLITFQDKEKFVPYFVLPSQGLFKTKLEAAGVKVFVVSMPKIRLAFGVSRAAKNILKIVKDNNIRLIHSNSIRTHLYGLYAARKAKIPIIWHQRNLLTNEILDPDRFFSGLADVIICNSAAVAKRFINKVKLSDKVRIVYNGADTSRFNPEISADKVRGEFSIDSKDIVVGIASRFDRLKGHEAFLESARIVSDDLSNSGKEVKFLIAGGAVFDVHRERERVLRDLSRKIGLEGKVIFTGFREDMPQIYSAMDIFVILSLAEACGRVIFEAMSCGKPVIATNSGGNPEIVEDKVTGLLVPPGDPKAVSEAIIYLIKNPEIARRMGLAGRQRILDNFDILKNVSKTELIYDELLSKYGE